jgi:uncharacterized protein (DUF39 family)
MVRGDLRGMSPRYLRGATYYRYGTTLYVGVGIPIPILNMGLAESVALTDDDIHTKVLDYGVPSRSRPAICDASYAELKSGNVLINGRKTPTSPLSSFKYAKEIAETLKRWVLKEKFLLSRPAELLPERREFKPLEADRLETKSGHTSSTSVSRNPERGDSR